LGYVFSNTGYYLFLGGPFAEEFGWRGFSLDRLQLKFSAFYSSLILGAIWGLWHLPLHFINGTTQEVIPFYQNFLILILLSIIYTWLYNNTNRSILVVMIFHLAGNMSGALFPYWISNLGRWISFILTLIFVIFLLIYYGPKELIREKKKI
jgi:membrane protease YdiL (CAAX protease family)